MIRIFILTILLNLSNVIISQNSKDYKIFQFTGTDSINGHISKIVRYNTNGQILFEELIDFMDSAHTGQSDYQDFYFYKDTLLTKIKTLNAHSIYKSQIKFSYNSKSQLVKKLVKDFEPRLRKRAYEDGCIIEDKDFTKPNWKKAAEIFYKYNLDGKLVESYAPKHNWDSQNKYLYEYDEEGKLIKETSLHDDKVIYVESRFFKNDGYDYSRLWSDEEQTSDSNSISSVRFKYNAQGKMSECSKPDETGIRGNIIEKYLYNKNGDIIRKQRFNTGGELEITHRYIRQ